MVYKDFCESLRECTSIEAADRLTIKFGEINTYKTRKLLVQDIVEFRTDYHLAIKYICRILANLDQKYKHEIRKNLTAKLQADYENFKARTTRTVNFFFDNRVRNMNFIIEFTKFRLILPNFVISLVLKSIEEFETIDKQIIVRFLENCGRFLRKYEESAERFMYLIDQLWKKIRISPSSDGIYRQIESCIHYSLLDKKEVDEEVLPKTEAQELAEYLINQVNETNLDFIVNELLRLPWSQEAQLIADSFLLTILKVRQEQVLVSHADSMDLHSTRPNLRLLPFRAGLLSRCEHRDCKKYVTRS